MPDESVDLVLTDCPYHIVQGGCTNIPIKEESSTNTFIRKNAKTGKIFTNNDIKFEEWLPHIYRVLKQDTHCYIMINPRNLAELQTKAEKVGFKFQNILIWYKNNSLPNRYYLNSYEMILMLRKGKARNINNMGTKNVLEIKNIIGNKSHPTEKPVELMKILIENSTNGGGIVLDPFMGTGATGVACKESGRDFIGIEIDKKYYDIAKERIGEEI
jgi:site-specific DNA-methyltransferase (adenine-specific)